MLVELIGDELSQLYNEIEKLMLFARGEKVIRADHVESLIGHHRIYGAFDVIDAMTGGNAGQAITRLRNMFEQDKSAEYSVVGAFAFHLRRMFQAKALLEKRISPADIAKQLRIWYNKDRFFAQLQRMTLSQIATFLEELAAVDYATKTGPGPGRGRHRATGPEARRMTGDEYRILRVPRLRGWTAALCS